VEASDALRVLERESQMKGVSLAGVERQTQKEYRRDSNAAQIPGGGI
jgi:hypothetical protein